MPRSNTSEGGRSGRRCLLDIDRWRCRRRTTTRGGSNNTVAGKPMECRRRSQNAMTAVVCPGIPETMARRTRDCRAKRTHGIFSGQDHSRSDSGLLLQNVTGGVHLRPTSFRAKAMTMLESDRDLSLPAELAYCGTALSTSAI